MNSLVGTGRLVRLILRRDRFLLPLWVVLLGVIPMSFVSATDELYPTAAELQQYADTTGTSPTFLALYGPLYAANLGGIVAQRMGFVPVVIALISLLTVIRHTRAEEEAGRRELLGATVLGRHAGTAAALTVTMVANLVLGALVALGMASQDLPVGGSVAFGLGFALVGCAFAGVGAVAAQVTEGAGAARGIGAGVLGVVFVVRLVGDVGGEDGGLTWLSWLSPLHWAHELRPYADERWWVAALSVALVVASTVAAVALSARRDVGAGLMRPRPGTATAAPGLRGPLALAWRLHRGPLLGWTVGFAALGVVYGGVAADVEDMVEDNPDLAEIFARIGGESGIVDAYFAAVLSTVALIASGYAIQAALKLRSEEAALRSEPVLATGVGRWRWAASHLTFALGGPVLVVAVAGTAAGLVHGLNTGDVGRELPRVLAGAAVQLPAVWVLAAIAVALFGLLPRFAAVSWGALAVFVLLGQFGAALQLDQWLLDASPFTHIPKVPGGQVSAAPMVWLVGIAVVLTVVGLAGFRRRDVPVG